MKNRKKRRKDIAAPKHFMLFFSEFCLNLGSAFDTIIQMRQIATPLNTEYFASFILLKPLQGFFVPKPLPPLCALSDSDRGLWKWISMNWPFCGSPLLLLVYAQAHLYRLHPNVVCISEQET